MKNDVKLCVMLIILAGTLVILAVGKPAVLLANDNGETKFFLPMVKGAFGLGIEPYVSGIVAPDVMTDIVDPGNGRLFIATRDGRVQISAPDGTLQPDLLLDIRDKVLDDGSEAGLIGLTIHPDFAANGKIYVYYVESAGDAYYTVVAQYSVGADGTADPASEQRLLHNEVPTLRHNAGAIRFGPHDGKLYIATGDGGTAFDRAGNSQSKQSLLGKILRIDVDSATPYAIPPDNPFAEDVDGRGEIWALGLRNPWRFSFDRLTGDMYIGDVGENDWEEINFIPEGSDGGENFGWPCREGPEEFQADTCDYGTLYIDPVYAYPQEECAAVVGGYVYRGEQLSELAGHYLFADVCDGEIRSLHRGDEDAWAVNNWGYLGQRFTTFGERSNGELLLGAYDSTIYQLVAR